MSSQMDKVEGSDIFYFSGLFKPFWTGQNPMKQVFQQQSQGAGMGLYRRQCFCVQGFSSLMEEFPTNNLISPLQS